MTQIVSRLRFASRPWHAGIFPRVIRLLISAPPFFPPKKAWDHAGRLASNECMGGMSFSFEELARSVQFNNFEPPPCASILTGSRTPSPSPTQLEQLSAHVWLVPDAI